MIKENLDVIVVDLHLDLVHLDDLTDDDILIVRATSTTIVIGLIDIIIISTTIIEVVDILLADTILPIEAIPTALM